MGTAHSKQTHPEVDQVISGFHMKPRRFVVGIIDMQNDFCKGGKLEVKGAEEALAAINRLRYHMRIQTFLSQDWHNQKHMSFAETHGREALTSHKLTLPMENGLNLTVEQMMWPRHCVENTKGAEFHRELIMTPSDLIVQKGTKTNVESYSAFGDEFHGKYERTELNSWLKDINTSDIILTGIASDYCVYNTALDAIRLGYKVHLILSCMRGVNKDTTDEAFRVLKGKGAIFYENLEEFDEKNPPI